MVRAHQARYTYYHQYNYSHITRHHVITGPTLDWVLLREVDWPGSLLGEQTGPSKCSLSPRLSSIVRRVAGAEHRLHLALPLRQRNCWLEWGWAIEQTRTCLPRTTRRYPVRTSLLGWRPTHPLHQSTLPLIPFLTVHPCYPNNHTPCTITTPLIPWLSLISVSLVFIISKSCSILQYNTININAATKGVFMSGWSHWNVGVSVH